MRGRVAAADALRPGRCHPGARIGALLEVMAADRYPAVRSLAWRSLRRLASSARSADTGPPAGYDPSAAVDERRREVDRLRSWFGTAEVAPPASLLGLRGRAPDRDLEIGE